MSAPTQAEWALKCAAKRREALDKIPREWLLPESVTAQLQYPLEEHPNRLIATKYIAESKVLTDRELTITEEFTAGELLKALAQGRFSSFEVALAFCKRAALAQQLVCAV